MNPLDYETKEVDDYYMTLEKMYPKAYNKKTTNPYTKTRVILMNGTEYESVWFLHQFARNCEIDEIKLAIAQVRKQEQMQQKRIACLKPLNESILETTIAYEQLAIDLTATLAHMASSSIKTAPWTPLTTSEKVWRSRAIRSFAMPV